MADDTKNQKPSINPGFSGSWAGTLRLVDRKIREEMEVMMPAKVISYDRATNMATVQPMVQRGGTDGTTKIDRPQIAAVPVVRYGGGGAVIGFPIKAGDVGYIIAGDRDASTIRENNYSELALPDTDVNHSFELGVFMPDSAKNWSVPGEDNGNTYIGSTSGNAKISFSDNTMKIVTEQETVIQTQNSTITLTPDNVKIVSGGVTMSLENGTLTIDGNVQINGNLSWSGTGTGQGDINVSGRVNANGGVTGSGIVLESHTHGGVETGGGNTGGPQ